MRGNATQIKHYKTRVFGVCNLDLYEANKAAGTFRMPVLEPANVPVPEKLIPFNVAVRLNRVPALSWAEPESFEYCFNGLPRGSTLAVARIDVECNVYFGYIWNTGFAEALRRLQPEKIFFYGKKHPLPQTDANVFFFENDRIKSLRAKCN